MSEHLARTAPRLTVSATRACSAPISLPALDPLWGFEPGVGIHLDDVYIARPQGALLDVYDVERIFYGPPRTASLTATHRY